MPGTARDASTASSSERMVANDTRIAGGHGTSPSPRDRPGEAAFPPSQQVDLSRPHESTSAGGAHCLSWLGDRYLRSVGPRATGFGGLGRRPHRGLSLCRNRDGHLDDGPPGPFAPRPHPQVADAVRRLLAVLDPRPVVARSRPRPRRTRERPRPRYRDRDTRGFPPCSHRRPAPWSGDRCRAEPRSRRPPGGRRSRGRASRWRDQLALAASTCAATLTGGPARKAARCSRQTAAQVCVLWPRVRSETGSRT